MNKLAKQNLKSSCRVSNSNAFVKIEFNDIKSFYIIWKTILSEDGTTRFYLYNVIKVIYFTINYSVDMLN